MRSTPQSRGERGRRRPLARARAIILLLAAVASSACDRPTPLEILELADSVRGAVHGDAGYDGFWNSMGNHVADREIALLGAPLMVVIDGTPTRFRAIAVEARVVRQNPDDGYACPLHVWQMLATAEDESMALFLDGADFSRPVGERETCGESWYSRVPTFTVWIKDPSTGFPGEIAPRLRGVGGHASITATGSSGESCRSVLNPGGGERAPSGGQSCVIVEYAVEGSMQLRRQEARATSRDPVVVGPPTHTAFVPRQIVRGLSITVPCSADTPTVTMCWEPVTENP